MVYCKTALAILFVSAVMDFKFRRLINFFLSRRAVTYYPLYHVINTHTTDCMCDLFDYMWDLYLKFG
ncbi:MAG: hypothetical protein FWH46_05245 [Methanimicrococcus sp.]|nr:hypothetical protein [Methanimicrococcus sp.]